MPDPSQDAAAFNARIVYWGIEGAGKRSSLTQVARKLRSDHRGELREVPTRLDPTVTYPVLPIELGDIGGIRTRIEIVAVPGDPQQVPTRKQLLDRADGVVFVVDSQHACIEANLAALEELRKALHAYARDLDEMPFIVQYNKRDLSDPYVIDELHRRMDVGKATVFESVATEGTGILQVLSTISKKVIRSLREASLSMDLAPPAPEVPPVPAAGPPAALSAAEPLPLEIDPPDFADELEAPDLETADLEAAILTSENHPEAAQIAAEVRAAEATLVQPHFDDLGDATGRGARIGEDLSIVSVGQATRADAHTVKVPVVLGDGEGEASTLMLTIRLDPLVPGTER